MKKYKVTVILILLILTSCLTTVHSLVTADNIITDDRIEGLWFDPGLKNIHVQKFMDTKYKNIFREVKPGSYTKKDSISYTKQYIISFQGKGLDYTLTAGIVKIKDQYYLSLEPEDCLKGNGDEVYTLHSNDFLTTSSIAKLDWKNNNSLVIRFLNGDRIKEIVLNGKARIKHEYDPLYDTFVITASSQELEQFLEKYGNNEMLFRGGNTIILTRKI